MGQLVVQEFVTADGFAANTSNEFNTYEMLEGGTTEFDRGQLRNAALMWEVIEDRDDLVKAVAGKRKRNIARNGFEIVTFPKKGTDGYEQALKQKEVLEYFYDQIVVTHTIDVMVKPEEIPDHIEVDVGELEINYSKHLTDIKLPPGVKSTSARLSSESAGSPASVRARARAMEKQLA